MLDIQELKILVKVDKDTGAITVANTEITNLGKTINSQNKQVQTSTKNWKDLAAGVAIGNFAYAAARRIISEVNMLIRNGIKDAEEAIKTERRLIGQLKNVGIAWNDVRESIKEYAIQVQINTRFNKDVTIQSLSDLIKYTGNVKKSQDLLNMSMKYATEQERPLEQVISAVSMALVSKAQGTRLLYREFGSLIDKTKDVNTNLKTLLKHYKDIKNPENETIKATNQLKNEFKDLGQNLGTILLPAITKTKKGLTDLLSTINDSLDSNREFKVSQETINKVIDLYTKKLADAKAKIEITTGAHKEYWENQKRMTLGWIEHYTRLKKKEVDINKQGNIQIEEDNEETKREREKALKEYYELFQDIESDIEKIRLTDTEFAIKQEEKKYNKSKEMLDKLLQDTIITAEQYRQTIQMMDTSYSMFIQNVSDKSEEMKNKSDEINKLMAQGTSQSFADMLTSGKNFHDSMSDFWGSMSGMFNRMIANQIQKTIEAALVTKAEATTEAGAKTVAAHAGIPFVGLILGLAAASAMANAIKGMKGGGIIDEPIMGIGKSGQRYNFGEGGTRERITPIGSNKVTNNYNRASNVTVNIGAFTGSKNELEKFTKEIKKTMQKIDKRGEVY